jgi:hypothetical protein
VEVLNHYIQPGDDPAQRRGLVQALGLILVGLAGAIGIYLTWRAQQHAREAQAENQRNTQDQLKQAREELNITRQGQMTERFTKAVEQLGSEKLENRLGGIYSLERTAKEEQNYHWPIMEVLTSYVRRHAPRESDTKLRKDAPTKPDIQAILDVIGRRSEDHREDEKVEYRTIELHDTDLRGADLGGAHLESASLAGADLRRAFLAGAHLQHAIVEDADLRGANLWGADLRHVYFFADTHLQDAVLNEVDLRAADLSRATELTQEQLDTALGDSYTAIPHGLQRPELWALEISDQKTRQRQLFEEALEEAATELGRPDERSKEEE